MIGPRAPWTTILSCIVSRRFSNEIIRLFISLQMLQESGRTKKVGLLNKLLLTASKGRKLLVMIIKICESIKPIA